MATMTIRNLPEGTHLALKHRAAINGTSMEAEANAILEEAVRPESRIRAGSELASLGKKFGGIDLQSACDPSTDPS